MLPHPVISVEYQLIGSRLVILYYICFENEVVIGTKKHIEVTNMRKLFLS